MNNNTTELIAVEHCLAEAEKLKDEEALLELISPIFEGVNPHGRRINRDAFIQSYTSQDLTIQSLDIDDVSVRRFDNIGTILGRSTFKGTFKNRFIEGSAEFIDIWLYNEKRWQLIGSHITPIEILE